MRVNPTGKQDASIMLVGEAPGETEERLGMPFVGKSSTTLNSLLAQAYIDRNDCFITNVAKERPPQNKIDHYFFDSKKTKPKPELMAWLEELREEIATVKPNVIVALGNTACWALTGDSGISKLRGAVTECILVPGVKVLPTYHPQAVGYDWSLAFTVIMDLRKAKRQAESPAFPTDNRTLIANASLGEFLDFCYEAALKKDPIVVDIETSRSGGYINRMGFASSPDIAISIPIVKGPIPCWNENDETSIWSAISAVISNCPTVYHNASFDVAVLFKHHAIWPCHIEMDTIIAAHSCFVESPKSLGYLASIILDVPAWKHTSGSDPGLYNAADCANTYGLYEFFKHEIDHQDVSDIYETTMAQLEPVIFMQLQGLDVDTEKLKTMKEEAEQRLIDVRKALDTLTGNPDINYNSPAQLKELLYCTLELPVQFKRRKSVSEDRKMTTDEEALKKLDRATGHPIVKLILEHRKVSKLISSFLDVEISPAGKIHTSYNITGTTSGRWSSSKSIIDPYGPGNLQNIPDSVRSVFTAGPGMVFIQADYVQAEAVVTAYLSGDRTLIRLFEESFGMPDSERKKSHDVHKYTAHLMYQVPVDEVTPEQRRVGKTLRHACNYSAGPGVIANQLGISLSEAKKLLQLYFDRNPHLKHWHQRIVQELRDTRTLTTVFGRKRRFLDRWGDSLFRSAYSFKPQSTVGDMLNSSLTQFYFLHGKEYDIVLQLHDAMYVRCPEDKVDDCMEKIRKCMITPLEINMETCVIDVDFKVGPSWGDMKPIERDWRYKG